MKAVLLTLALMILPVRFHARAQETEPRYRDVVYLDEARAKPLPVRARHAVNLLESRDTSTIVYKFEKGATVWLLGFGKAWCYAQISAQPGSQRGWVDADALEDAPEDVRSQIESTVRTAHRRKDLIARHEVEVGMTRNQAMASLGKPDEITRTGEGENAEERWSYRTFKTVPQRDSFEVGGQTLERMHYRKVQTSGRTVTIRNDQVVEIQEDKPSSQ